MPITNTLTVKEISPTEPSIGVGITGVADWQDSPFLDIARNSRNGELTGLSGTGNTAAFFISSQGDDGGDEGRYRDGAHTLMWDGGAGVGVTSGSRATVNSAADPGGTSLTLEFSGNMLFEFTNVDAADPPTNIRIVKDDEMDQYLAGHHLRQVFIDAFTSRPKVVRMMDWMGTNASPVVDWADYPKLDWQSWDRVPVPVMTELANRLECDLWVNIPHQATDAFVTSFIQEIENNLDAGLRIYPEFSNEIWNWGFSQTDYCIDQAVAEWGVGGGLPDGINWGMKRFVESMRLAQAVSSRLDGYIGLWANGSQHHTDYMDAPIWAANEPGNYEPPHSVAEFAGPTHYFGKPYDLSNAMGAAFLAEVGTGSFQETKRETRKFWDTAIETTKGYIDSAAAACTAADTVNGGSRNLKLMTYEGGQHTDIGSYRSAVWYQIPPIFDGMQVGRRTPVLSNGRVYESQSESGVVGASFPSHTDGSDQTINGIVWRDITGQEFSGYPDGGWDLRIGPEANGTRLGDPAVRWNASTAVTDGDRVANSTGLVYAIGTTGTTGTTEPTHTSGTQTIDGIDYTASAPTLGDNAYSRDYVRLCDPDLMYGEDMAAANYKIFKHIKSLGGFPTVFTSHGRAAKSGFWGIMRNFKDVGTGRERELWDAFMAMKEVL